MINDEPLLHSFNVLRDAIGDHPVSAVSILGSGWSETTEGLPVCCSVSYCDIPILNKGHTIPGHAGTIDLIKLADRYTLVFRGRRHYYEGLGWEPIAFPVFAAKRFGARSMLLTNAAGGIAGALNPGDLMLIRDHINMMGTNPLMGAHKPFWGPRFPDQTAVYTAELRRLACQCAAEHNIALHEGIYLATTGPTYETPAEIRWFRSVGADAVGMSTVPEAILANAAGLQVCAVSCITNPAAGTTSGTLSHAEVLSATAAAKPAMTTFLTTLIKRFCAVHPPL